MNESFYLGLANELAAKVRRVSSFVSHAPSIGTYHEEALKTILRHMLPARFSLRTGFAYDPQNGPSHQGDILIVDENNPGAYFFREGDFAVVSHEALVCVIEVKTNLIKKEFTSALTALASFRRMPEWKMRPPTFLFAYESPAFTPKTLNSWYDSVSLKDDPRNYPWAVYSLTKGLVLFWRATDTEWGHCVVEGEQAHGPKVRALSVFLQTVRKALILHAQSSTDPFVHALADGLTLQPIGYRFGASITAASAPEA